MEGCAAHLFIRRLQYLVGERDSRDRPGDPRDLVVAARIHESEYVTGYVQIPFVSYDDGKLDQDAGA